MFKQLVSFLCLCVLVVMSGCGVEHKWIQQDKGKYLVYTQPPIDVLRQNPTPEPTYCTKLVDVEYDPPLPGALRSCVMLTDGIRQPNCRSATSGASGGARPSGKVTFR